MRLFVAVDPGKEVMERIGRAIEKLRRASPASKWVQAKHCHITLVFLGQVEDERVAELGQILSGVAGRHKAFHLGFKGGGSFGAAHRPNVLWAGLEGDVDVLYALQKDLAAALIPFGHKPEARPYKAHLTLARARESGGDLGLAACVPPLQKSDFGHSGIAEIVLFRSDLSPSGPHYTPIFRAPLCPQNTSTEH